MAEALTADEARRLFRYDPESGKLYWKVRAARNVMAGDEAGANPNGERRMVRIRGKKYLNTRIAWLLMTGEWPELIDHINGDTRDDRWCNLRDVGPGANSRNCKTPRNNTSGVVGVMRSGKKWVAKIKANYRTIHLGTFDTIEEAAKARKQAEREHGFHENHGRTG